MKKKIQRHEDGTKILSERNTRAGIMSRAKDLGQGAERDVAAIFDKYDKAMHKCTNQQERSHMAAVGAAELHRYFYCRGNLVVSGKEILPAETGHDDAGELIKI